MSPPAPPGLLGPILPAGGSAPRAAPPQASLQGALERLQQGAVTPDDLAQLKATAAQLRAAGNVDMAARIEAAIAAVQGGAGS